MNKRKLFIVYNRAVAKAKRLPNNAGDKIIQRLKLALGILQHHDYYQAEKELYHPNTRSCGCKDWQYRKAHKRAYTGHCKHMIAEVLLERIHQLVWTQTDFLFLVTPSDEDKISRGRFLGFSTWEINQKGFCFNNRRLDIYNRYCRALAKEYNDARS